MAGRSSVLSVLRGFESSGARRQRYLMSVVALIAVLFLQDELFPVLGARAPFLLPLLGVMFCAWYGGLRSGLLAVGITTVASKCFWAYSFAFEDPPALDAA
jgi:hypothetical protein